MASECVRWEPATGNWLPADCSNVAPVSDLAVLESCRTNLTRIDAKTAERVIKYLQDWNKSRPAEDT